MAADRVSGMVNDIRDGDTIRVSFSGKTKLPKKYLKCSKVYKTMAWVHLLGVIAPEPKRREQCYKEASNFTRALAIGKRVTVYIDGCGQYGGLEGIVSVEVGSLGKSLNYEIIKAGLAKMERDKSKFKNKKLYKKYRLAEGAADAARIGVWGKTPCKLKSETP